MSGVAKWFTITALLYAILGFVVGLHMAMSHDHGQMPTHAHIMVIGWVSFFLFGIFYHLFRDRIQALLSLIHFVVAELALAGLVIALWNLYSGNMSFEPVAAISSMAYAGSFLVFALNALLVINRAA